MDEWIASMTGSECGRKQEAGVPTSCMPQLNLFAVVWPSLTSSPQHLMNVLENAEVSALLKARVLHSVVGEEAALRTSRRALAAGIKTEECHIWSEFRIQGSTDPMSTWRGISTPLTMFPEMHNDPRTYPIQETPNKLSERYVTSCHMVKSACDTAVDG